MGNGIDIDAGLRSPEVPPKSKIVPLYIGDALVYIEAEFVPTIIAGDDEITPVSPPSPREVFDSASEALGEFVRVIGEKVKSLKEVTRPSEIKVEFSLTFYAEGRMSLIPVLVTGKTGAETGLKVTATWNKTADNLDGTPLNAAGNKQV